MSETPALRRRRRSIGLLAAAFALTLLGGYGLVQWQGWRLPYTLHEVGGAEVDPDALAALQALRVESRSRWRVVSGHRSREHNRAIGGARHSQHVHGRAFDVIVPQGEREAFYSAAKAVGFTAFGWGNRTVHIDTGKRRWWTYDDAGKHLGGRARHAHVHKAPASFKRDFRLAARR